MLKNALLILTVNKVKKDTERGKMKKSKIIILVGTFFLYHLLQPRTVYFPVRSSFGAMIYVRIVER